MNENIEMNPDIHFGKPIIRGTRVPVTRILGEVAAGTPWNQIETQYDITKADIQAAVAFANELVAECSFVPRKSKLIAISLPSPSTAHGLSSHHNSLPLSHFIRTLKPACSK
jgi:uncharacterized protein (DUF433 family)